MSDIFTFYKKFNFSVKEMEKLKRFDKDVDRFSRLQDKERKKMKIIEKRIDDYNKKKRGVWTNASKLHKKLQERCKHYDIYKVKIHRDFGDDILRTTCSFCGLILHDS